MFFSNLTRAVYTKLNRYFCN